MKTILSVLLIFFLITGCNQGDEREAATEKSTIETMDTPELKGSSWILTELQEKSVQKSEDWGVPEITFHKEDNRLSGYGGCNQLNGSFILGDDNEVRFSQIATTKRYCEPVMALEDNFLAILNRVSSYRMDNETLILLFDDHTVAARFTVNTPVSD